MLIKICTKCKIEKDINQFCKNKNEKEGLNFQCKSCAKKYLKLWRILNKEKKYPIEEKIKTKSCSHCKIEKSANQFLKGEGKFWLTSWCKECLNKQARIKQKNYPEIRRDYLRTRLCNALKGINKSKSTVKLLGCSTEFLKQHLEKQFKQGMNWDNWGTGNNGTKQWNIDHIKPCARFDFKNKSEQLKCFNYKNLQPLWAEENRVKNDKYLK